MEAADIDTPPGMPRWVKVFVVLGIVLILIVAIVLVATGGDHGPGRHTPMTEDAVAPPPLGAEATDPATPTSAAVVARGAAR